VAGIRKAGYAISNADKIVQMWAVGVNPEDLKVGPVPPTPPRPPRLPRADDDGGDG
jgi:hypothetical protein